jgi:6-phosphogluconolactonase
MRLHRFADASAAARACADTILKRLEQAIAGRGAAYLAVSGGSSPKTMFEIFSRRQFAWDRVHLFWVDERVVPPNDPQSNYKLANDAWLTPAKFPAANVHRVLTELGPEPAAERYTEEIRSSVHPPHVEATSPLPCFDVIHRGMGPDGHTASLFPGEPLIADHGGIAAAVWVEKMHQWRVTLLPGVLESARHTVLLVTGADKAAMLKTVRTADFDPSRYPVQIASLVGEAEWFVDAAANP